MMVERPNVSDAIEGLIQVAEASRHTGLIMTQRNVATYISALTVIRDEAKHLENLVDKMEWNRRASGDAKRNRRAELEAAIADGKVSILPVVPRATAVRRGPEGGAA